jgi:RNA polymerase sigma-32 factor
MDADYLDRARELDLATRWQKHKDEAALHELIASHARLVVRVAWDFRRSGMPLGDLIQEGNVGLAQAAARFDPERNVRFSTYAGWWIMAEIQDFILRNASIVRFATTPMHRSLFFKLRRLRARHATGADGTLPHEHKVRLAREIGATMEEVERIDAALARGDQSLNAVRDDDDDGDAMQDFLADPGPTPEESAIEHFDRGVRSRQLREALDKLSSRERQIIVSRFLSEEKLTLSDIGQRFGVSKERVRQLENKALDKLRGTLRDTMAAA